MESHGEWLERMRSIGVSTTQRTRVGVVDGKKVTVERAEGATTVHTEHASGRVDATVTPATIRNSARVHKTGQRKGQIAEITPMALKEKRERYAES